MPGQAGRRQCESRITRKDDRHMAREKTLHDKIRELGRNLWWSWQPEVTAIFREIDPPLWSQVDHNPVLLLEAYPPEKLEERASEAVLHTRINWAYRRWQEY